MMMTRAVYAQLFEKELTEVSIAGSADSNAKQLVPSQISNRTRRAIKRSHSGCRKNLDWSGAQLVTEPQNGVLCGWFFLTCICADRRIVQAHISRATCRFQTLDILASLHNPLIVMQTTRHELHNKKFSNRVRLNDSKTQHGRMT